jgi:hypothetical protein
MREIKISIDRETYEVEIEGVGFMGQNCISEIDKVMRILQAETVRRTPKPEYFYVSNKKKVRR